MSNYRQHIYLAEKTSTLVINMWPSGWAAIRLGAELFLGALSAFGLAALAVKLLDAVV